MFLTKVVDMSTSTKSLFRNENFMFDEMTYLKADDENKMPKN